MFNDRVVVVKTLFSKSIIIYILVVEMEPVQYLSMYQNAGWYASAMSRWLCRALVTTVV